MEKHYRVFAVIFAIVGFICMLGGLVFLFINEMYHVTIWWYFVIGMILVILGGVCGYTAAVFSNLAGGTVEHIGTSIRTELPPKIVLPTDTLKIMCPFECTCEKHHDKKHLGIDIAPQIPDTEGDSVYAVTKGKIYVDRENGIARLECKMFRIIYRCLKTITAENGAKVKAGDMIRNNGRKRNKRRRGTFTYRILEYKIFFFCRPINIL